MPGYRMLFEDTRGWMYLVTGGLPPWVVDCPEAVGYWISRDTDGRRCWDSLAKGHMGWNVAHYGAGFSEFGMFDLLIWVPRPASNGVRAVPNQKVKTARELLQDLNNEENRLRDRAREKSRKLRIRETNRAD